MKHIRPISNPVDKASGFGIGGYLLLAGQILGILALAFVDKDLQAADDEDSGEK
ncbi:MAG: hypothetical protein KAH38_06040 [Candidatus Hydrogenedentes bacterium]|nr:hypothetical protein [Candidatus Hydrogenedentota bacterium]